MMRIREASFILSLFVVLLFALRLDMRAGDFFPIRMLDARMATLSVSVEGENGILHRPFPYYSPTKGEKLLISFDLLDAMPEEIGYTLSYCDESWHPVSVPHGLAVVGFAEGLLAASQPSVMTQVLYRHYSLCIDASSETRPILPGNWLLRLHLRSDPSTPIAEVGFALLKNHCALSARVTPYTPKGNYSSYQAVESKVYFDESQALLENGPYKLVVGQNGRRDNVQVLETPSFFSPEELFFERNEAAVFEAGNEYHSFEMLSKEHSNMGVQSLLPGVPEQAILYPQHNRSALSYIVEKDADGLFVVRAPRASYEADLTADYYEVDFRFSSERLKDNVLLVGEAFEALPNEERVLQYSTERGCYEATLLLKAGYYSFLYASAGEHGALTTRLTEGNHYQTQNSYTILLYRGEIYPFSHMALIGAYECSDMKK